MIEITLIYYQIISLKPISQNDLKIIVDNFDVIELSWIWC